MSDLAAGLLGAWGISPPQIIQPINKGANNRTFLIDAVKERYILRIYPASANLERIQDELAVLAGLQRAELTFSVPQPIATIDGRMIVPTEADIDGLAVLFTAITGQPLAFVDAPAAFVCGAALAELDDALSILAIETCLSRPAFGDLRQTHPLVPNPVDAVALLPFPMDVRTHLRTLLEGLDGISFDLSARLPAQLIHADFDPSNVLVDSDQVSGVLDFEFAALAPRAMDFTIGLYGFAGLPRAEATYWRLIVAFAAGYQQRSQLSAAEIGAVPTLMRLREATSLVHWMGRGMGGDTTKVDLVARAGRLLRLDDALTAVGEEMIHCITAV